MMKIYFCALCLFPVLAVAQPGSRAGEVAGTAFTIHASQPCLRLQHQALVVSVASLGGTTGNVEVTIKNRKTNRRGQLNFAQPDGRTVSKSIAVP